MKEKVLVAMSGGVDSAVAALLLTRAGYDCIGVTLKFFRADDTVAAAAGENPCCSLTAAADARAVARVAGIPHYVFNFTVPFERYVIQPFIRAYLAGLTPNPCIDCNRRVKFPRLWRRAREMGAAFIATGHYAVISRGGGRWLLSKAADRSKDQSYALYGLTQEELAHTLLPLGLLSKSETRRIAAANALPNAGKPDSQDICFAPDGDYAGFIERRTGTVAPPGDFIGPDGRRLGRHKGLIRYTVGQRRGLGIAWGEPLYVCAKNAAANTVRLGGAGDLERREFDVGEVNFIAVERLERPRRAAVKIRYGREEYPATLEQTGPASVHVVLAAPRRAVTPGQAAVFYENDTVLGGGVIL
ncbi:MAG: tRNA 2-thiouridine(34) synthase MnmA [Gracilibacteraceae bacterium]|nr:tRNA 2-thiouridine(34) synthase MnmA [Gracilibacteraceae bacterium]